MAKKKTMQNKKKKLRKMKKINSLIRKEIKTIKQINGVELLLKRLLQPIHLPISENPLLTEVISTISGIRQDQFNYYIENRWQLQRMEMNAENAYHATLDNSYLDIIKEIKNVVTDANLAYEATQLPLE